MAARSHIDLCLFVQVIQITANDLPDELRRIVHLRDSRAIAEYLSANPEIRLVNIFTEIHESIHTAQAVTYPFLRVFSMLTWSQVYRAFSQLSEMHSVFLDFTVEELNAHFLLPEAKEMSRKYYVWIEKRDSDSGINDLVMHVSPDSADPRAFGQRFLELNAVDLIENAASIIQLKMMEHNDSPLWLEYIRWCRRNPSNSQIVESVAKHLGQRQIFLDSFAALCYAAFCTNKPVLTFVSLLLRLAKSIAQERDAPFYNQPEPRRWVEVFDRFLDELNFSSVGEYSISERYERFDPYWTSTLRYGRGREEGMPHPVIGKMVEEWGLGEKNDVAFRYAIIYPNGYSGLIIDSGIMTSPIRVLKFMLNDGSTFIATDGDLSRLGLSVVDFGSIKVGGKDFGAMFRDFMCIFGYVRTFCEDLRDKEFRLCAHSKCPQFERNLCNGWIHVPRDFSECGFPKRIDQMIIERRALSARRGDRSWMTRLGLKSLVNKIRRYF